MHPGILAGAHVSGPLVIGGALRLSPPALLVLVAVVPAAARVGTEHPAQIPEFSNPHLRNPAFSLDLQEDHAGKVVQGAF